MDIENDAKGEEIVSKFQELSKLQPNINPAIGAIKTLLYFIGKSEGSTVNYLAEELNFIVKVLSTSTGKSKLAIESACAQFIRFATLNLATIESEDMATCKKRIELEGNKYLKRCEGSIQRIVKLGVPFIFDGSKVLVHSNSRVVLRTLQTVPDNIQFQLYVTNSEPEKNAGEVVNQLKGRANIECYIINESEIAYIMEEMDLVMVGAEAVVKNGGIINKVGTLGIGICAKEMNKPMYVLAESFKFSLLYPLNQSDVPAEYRFGEDKKVRVDYTPPKYLTLLVTDRGLLTPTAVCDELIEMYV